LPARQFCKDPFSDDQRHELDRTPPSPPTRTCLALGAVLGGCDRRTPAAKSVAESSAKLHTVQSSVSRIDPSASSHAVTQYKSVSSDSQNPGDGLPGETAAAQLLAAESQLGLTETSTTQAARIERDVLNRIALVRSVLAGWSAHNARATAAALYDPTQAIDANLAKAKEFDASAEQSGRERDALQKKVDDLKAQAKTQFDQVQSEEVAISQIRQQAASAGASEAARLIEQAAERRRAADKIRTAGSLLEAQADALMPQLREFELRAEQFTSQAKSLRDAVAEMRARAEDHAQRVQQSRAAAAAAAQEIDAQVAEIADIRSKALDEAYQAALSAFQQASSTVGKARQDQSFPAAKVTEGNIKQGLGDVHWARAQGLATFKSLLDRLTKGEPALPNASKFAEQAKAAGEQAAESLTSAKDAYESAASAYSGARIKGDGQERLQALGEKLNRIAQITSGQGLDALASLAAGTYKPAPDAENADAPVPEDDAPAPDAAAEPLSDEDAVRAVYDTYIAVHREMNTEQYAAIVYVPSTELQPVIDAMIATTEPTLRLEKAVKAKFGQGLRQLLASIPGMGQSGQSLGFVDLDAFLESSGASLTDLTVAGTEASAKAPGLATPVNFIKDGETWKLRLKEIEAMGPMAIQALPIMKAMSGMYGELADEVDAGQYADANAFSQGLMQKLQQAMVKAMQQGGGGGGG
jgi:hypothetical protein